MAANFEEILENARQRNFERFEKHVSPQWVKMLRTIGLDRDYVHAEGPYLFDKEGNKYLDFMINWGVFNFGRNHPQIRRVIRDAIESDFPGWVAFDAPALSALLAERLTERVPNELDIVYFCNSGAECVEAAIKFARANTGKSGIVHLSKSFHGMTNGALAVNGEPYFRDGFGPFLPRGVEVPLNDFDALERAFRGGDIGAFIFEPVQGKGVYIPSDDFLLRAQELCRQYGALMICDEVQTGMGRTGRFLGCEWAEGLDPDMILLAKALSGGYVPVGAVITRRAIYDRVYTSTERAMAHACTFGMGNLAMAAGLASLQVLEDEKLLENAQRMGKLIKDGLEAMKDRFEFIHEIRQRGLMIGIEFGKPRSARLKAAWSMIHKAHKELFPQATVIPLFEDHCILTQVAGHNIDVIKLLPPLTISEEDVRWFLEGFEECMVNLHEFPGPVWELLKRLSKHAVTARSG